MATRKVVPGSLKDAYKLREGDFAPDLVGNQLTSPKAFGTFTNFGITENFDGVVSKDFKLGPWSEYYCLENLNISEEELDEMISNTIFVKLNYNKKDISRYVYFGSFYKFAESEIEDIIIKWPASLYISVDPVTMNIARASNINTVLDFSYDPSTKITRFKTPVAAIENPYNLSYDFNPFNEGSIVNQLGDYVLRNEENGGEYDIVSLSSITVNYLYFTINGNCFSNITGTTFSKENFHIKPKKGIIDTFFFNLTDFQKVLLNRLTIPKYTAIFDVPVKYDNGTIGFSIKTFTWPVSDGYNLDIGTSQYGTYIEDIFNLAKLYDENKTDLVLRRMVSESIREFDTDGDGSVAKGMKVSKLLRIYGREFDVVKKYIDGISFANVVTYNKEDNTADSLIKMMAKTLGFDVLLTTGGFNLLENNEEGDDPQFAGYSRELSATEIDIELWRRLVINAWWLFRSKGTRKVLEFFMRLFGINSCLVSMDERVYLAKDKLDMFELKDTLNNLFGPNYFDLNLSTLPLDIWGFPKVPLNTETFWFQNDGFWYNGGNEITTGNNPHYGPYDYGQRYWNKFMCLVPNFQSTSNINRVELETINFFTEYNNGTLSPNEEGPAFSNYGYEIPNFFISPDDNTNIISMGTVVFGEENGPENISDSGDTFSMRITFQAGEPELCDICPTEFTFDDDGIIYYLNENGVYVPHDIEECCDFYWIGTEIEPCPPHLIISTIEYNNNKVDWIENVTNEYCCNEAFLGIPNVQWVLLIPGNPTSGACVVLNNIPPLPPLPPHPDIIDDTKSSGINFVLDIPRTLLKSSGFVNCANGDDEIINPPCISNNCVDTIFGNLTVNKSSTVDLTFSLFGGSISKCCKYTASLKIDNNIYILSALANNTETQTITLGEGVYSITLSLISYTCTNGYATISVSDNTLIISEDRIFTGPLNESLEKEQRTPEPEPGELPEPPENIYYCWWCPPKESLIIVCNTSQFLETLGVEDSEIISLAQSYGYTGILDPTAALFFLEILLDQYFESNNCFYMVDNQILIGKKCCKIRGGIWNSKLNLCELPINIDDCHIDNIAFLYGIVGELPDPQQNPSENNFDILNKSCCESLGYHWSTKVINGNVTLYLTNNTTETILLQVYNQPAFQYLYFFIKPWKYAIGCFECPLEIKETLNNDSLIVITDLNDVNLSETCCNRYGFYYDSSTNECFKCDNTNIIIDSINNTVTNSNGSQLTQNCCESSGFVYETVDGKDGCFICPNIQNGYILQDIDNNGITVTYVLYSNGQQLSRDCCTYYQNVTGTPTLWDPNLGCSLFDNGVLITDLIP